MINIDDQNKVRLSRKAVIMEAPDFNPADYEGMGVPESASRRPARAGAPGGRDNGGQRRGGRGRRSRAGRR